MLSRSLGMPSCKTGPPSIWDTHMVYRETFFANPAASSSAPYPQELNPWSSNITEDIHSSQAGKSENQTRSHFQRCQSGPSARNSFISSDGQFSKNYGADQRLQISDLHFDNYSTPTTFACWKTRFKTQVCTCSQFPTEAMHWIKEVEMVDSVDDLKSSLSVRGIRIPDFEVLDAKIVSALNRIIHNTQFTRTVSLEEQKAQEEDRFFRGRQIAYLMYEYFGLTGANDSVENYADLFTIALLNDDIQEFDSKWDGSLLSMTKILGMRHTICSHMYTAHLVTSVFSLHAEHQPVVICLSCTPAPKVIMRAVDGLAQVASEKERTIRHLTVVRQVRFTQHSQLGSGARYLTASGANS